MDQVPTAPQSSKADVRSPQLGMLDQIESPSGDLQHRFRHSISAQGRVDDKTKHSPTEALDPLPEASAASSIGPAAPMASELCDSLPAAWLVNAPMTQRLWASNGPAILVASSQLFGALMNLGARLLELEGDGMHPVQVLFLRQSLTSVCCFFYMWRNEVPHAPWGREDVRLLLVVRGVTGFFGIFGLWYSMMYLPLADATVITFLSPAIAGVICFFLLHEPFTRPEQIATVMALLGVVLIAQPATLFMQAAPPHESQPNKLEDHGRPSIDHEATTTERLVAIGVALLGSVGAAGAFTSLRSMGQRAHPLISVNSFGIACAIICALTLALAPVLDVSQPSLRWVTPVCVKQWALLLMIGTFGFLMQYLMTAGLAADKSNRANSMVYTHMLFAVAFDRWVFGHRMGLMSFLGCASILGSAFGVILIKRPPPRPKVEDVESLENLNGASEGSPMLTSGAIMTEMLNMK